MDPKTPVQRMRVHLKQLEKELVTNRLLFPAKPLIGTGPLEHQNLSKQLQSLLPSIDNAMRIMNQSVLSILRRYHAYSVPGTSYQKLPPFQQRDVGHPVLLARELLQLAVCFQLMHKDTRLSDFGLPGASPWDLADRYFEVSSSLVTSQDNMIASHEGIESLLLEAFFKANKGDVRGAWMTLRRALNIAQLIGLPPRDWSEQPLSVYFVWTRLVFGERFVSLMLGVPSSVNDDNYRPILSPHSAVTAAYADNFAYASQDLERHHAAVMPRIAARNHRLNQLAYSSNYYSDQNQFVLHDLYRETQDIDHSLKQTAHSFPAAWWVIPNFKGRKMQWAEKTEETARIMAQVKHFYLLLLLHIPYLTDRRLGFSPVTPPQPMDPDIGSHHAFADFKTKGSLTTDETTDETAEKSDSSASMAPRRNIQYSSLPSSASKTSSTLATPSPPVSGVSATEKTTAPAVFGPVDAKASRMSALLAAREVLYRFLEFRHCLSEASRCHIFDFEAFVVAVSIIVMHIDAQARSSSHVGHDRRRSDLTLIDEVVVLMDVLRKHTQGPHSTAQTDILQRLRAIEKDAAAGGRYDIWAEEGTLGKGEGWVTKDVHSQIQTFSVPFFGRFHILRLSPLVGDGSSRNGDDLAIVTY